MQRRFLTGVGRRHGNLAARCGLLRSAAKTLGA
jgi:hypothetical protein